MKQQHGQQVATLATLSLLTTLYLASPAHAETPPETPSATESAQAISAAAAEVFEETHESLDVDTSSATAEIIDPASGLVGSRTELSSESNAASIAEIGGTEVSLKLVNSTTTSPPSEITDDGKLYVEHEAGVGSTAVVKEDGSVQVVSTIASREATERIAYEFSAPKLAAIEEVPGGALILRDTQGAMLGGVAPAWARDANGLPVATHYEIDGDQVIQVVQHSREEYTYPVVADPFWGTALFDRVQYYNSTHVLTLSGWGRSLHYGLLNTPHDPLVYYRIFANDGWNEFVNRSPGRHNINHSVRQQYYCHAAYGKWPIGGPTWDLETWRPALVYNNYLEVQKHECNWNTPAGNK